jgi:hypothetical protein
MRLLLFLVACTTQGLPADEQPSSLRFTTSTMIPQNPPPNLDVTVTDLRAVRSAYRATTSLAHFAGGITHCPPDFGVHYQLKFYSDDSLVLDADVDAGGCSSVQLQPENSTRAATSAFFATLATSLQVPEAAIYPYLPPQ